MKIKTSSSILLVITVLFSFFMIETTKLCAADEKVGGACEYNDYKGIAAITNIKKTGNSLKQVRAKGGCGYQTYEVWFMFKPDEEIEEEWARDALKKEHLFQLTNSWYVGRRYIEKYKLRRGKTYKATMKVIKKGTCTPIIFVFDDLQSDDYFESKKDKK